MKKININLLTVIMLFCCSSAFSMTEVEKKMVQMHRQFWVLYNEGNDSAFYQHAKAFEELLIANDNLPAYYKTKTNEGLYDIKENHLFRAISIAEALDADARSNNAVDYYYLATGLMGNIYRASHDTRRAELYFVQALDEVGDRDPKFRMVTLRDLAQLLCIKNPSAAIEYTTQAEKLAEETEDMNHLSLSKAMKIYIQFINGDRDGFENTYREYQQLMQKKDTAFNHQYDNIVEIARLTFDGAYQKAAKKLKEGDVFVDSSLVAVRIYAYAGEIENGFKALNRRYAEMDSIFSIAQVTNFNQMATERTMIRSLEQASESRKKVKNLTNWIIGIIVVFLIIYIMGRRRLTRIIWDKNKKLEEALARAEESNQMKMAFINNMSHEIRTPLNAVGGFSTLLCQSGLELSEEEKKDIEERITYNVDLITTIVSEVLEFANSESQSRLRPDSEMSDVKINEVCRTVLRSMDNNAKEGVETRFTTNVADDFIVRTHPSTLKRILTHIINNAKKFTESGSIELRCEYDKSARKMLLIVEDTGVGIKPEDQDRIFDLFEKATGNFKEGIGLGLPISQRLATSIGAEILLDAEYTEGCRFVLSIPMKK